MGYSYKAVYNKDNRRNKSGLHSIFIRATVDGISSYFNLGERVEDKYWTGKDDRWIRESHPCAFELNTLIKKKLDLMQKHVFRQKIFDNAITLSGIKEHFHKKASPNIFNEYVDEFIKTVTGKSVNTLKKYRTFKKYLNEFNPRIKFNQLHEQLFQSFAIFLGKKGMLGITVIKYFDPFKVIVKQATKDGYFDKDPFTLADIGVKPTKGERVYLEIEEIKLLRNVKIPIDRPDLADTRDHWLFCFYASFYHSDLRKLTWPELKRTDFGYCILGTRFKNGKEYISPIHKFPYASVILEKQRGKGEDQVFPGLITDQKYNEKLKELSNLAGITKNLMNKTARHSSIQFWESQGLETQHTSKIAGHSNESTTKQYYKLSIRDINQRVEKMDFSKLDI